MYKKIRIENFRGISSLEIKDPRQFNLFVGQNNSGKTSILEAIFLLTGPANPRLPVVINSFRNFHYITEYTWSLFFYKLDFNSRLTLKGELIKPKESRSLTIKPLKETSMLEATDKGGSIVAKDNHTVQIDKIIGLSLEASIKKENSKKPDTFSSLIKAIGQKLDTKLTEDYTESRKGVFIHSNYTFESNARRFNDILIKKQEKSIIDILQKLEPEIKDLALGFENILYCDIGLEKILPMNLIGEGINRLLSIILAIYDASNGVVLIDESENGFHYSTLELLWTAIFESARQFNVQIFATTHSFENIKAYSNAYEKFSAQEDNMRLYRMEKEDDRMQLVEFNHQLLKSSLESGWEIR